MLKPSVSMQINFMSLLVSRKKTFKRNLLPSDDLTLFWAVWRSGQSIVVYSDLCNLIWKYFVSIANPTCLTIFFVKPGLVFQESLCHANTCDGRRAASRAFIRSIISVVFIVSSSNFVKMFVCKISRPSLIAKFAKINLVRSVTWIFVNGSSSNFVILFVGMISWPSLIPSQILWSRFNVWKRATLPEVLKNYGPWFIQNCPN